MIASINSPMPGKIIEICVKPGDSVKKGQTLVILESMKMHNEIVAENPGIVYSIHKEVNEFVPTEGNLVRIEYNE